MDTPKYTSPVIEIHTKRGLIGRVSSIDRDLALLKWAAHGKIGQTCYLIHRFLIDGLPKSREIHRIIMSRVMGRELIKGEYVDHIDGNGLNNVRENLRLCTNAQNRQNAKRNKNNGTGYKGVTKVVSRGYVYYQVHVQCQYIGTFKTPEDAYNKYCEEAIKRFGEFAKLK